MSTFVYLCDMEIVNYTNFRSNLKHWFDKVIDDVSDVVIKRKNGKDLVLISLDEYNSLKETTYLLSGKNRDVLLDSVKELEEGKGKIKDLIE
jgi:antitoxin YefM